MATTDLAAKRLVSPVLTAKIVAALAADDAIQIGAANPKAIAELRLGRTLDPHAADFEKTVADALGTPVEHLFDPKFGSPVFPGIQRVLAAPVPVPAPEAAAGAAAAVGAPPKATVAIKDVHLPAAASLVHREISFTLPDWFHLLFTDLTYAVPGTFIVDVPTVTAPVQGALADCWLISAMASVAWCHSDAIAERTLKDGTGVVSGGGADYEFTFYASADWAAAKNVRVRDDVPQSSGGSYIYGRSSVAGETWPANLEKAFIGMRGATGIGEPSSSNYDELNYGDPAWAVASLVGRAPWYHAPNASDAWSTINTRCTNGRATQPMTAWTYGTGSATVSYDGSGIVANHAYSILGTESSGGHEYVILRNPWGYHEGTLNVLPGTWQGLTLPGDGVFALQLETFAQYYAGFGGA
jgi:Calpain family cysteine protease